MAGIMPAMFSPQALADTAAQRGFVRARVHALRPGTWPADPEPITLTAEDIAAIAAAYDPARYQAPVVIGHPETDDPAWGWVMGASAESDGLWLDVELLPEMADLVREGRYRAVSVSLWMPDAPGNPTPGVWSLKHLGYLGAVPPAVKGLAPTQLDASAQDGGTVTISLADGAGRFELLAREPDIERAVRFLTAAIARHQRHMDGTEPTTEESQRRLMDEMLAALSALTLPMTPSEEMTMSEKDQSTQSAQLAERERQLAEREAAIARREREIRRAAYAQELDAHVAAGRILPAEKAELVELMEHLEGAAAITLAEGGERSALDALRGFLARLPQRVALGEHAKPAAKTAVTLPGIPQGYRLSERGLELHTRAVEYMAAHPGTDYLTAVRAVERTIQ